MHRMQSDPRRETTMESQPGSPHEALSKSEAQVRRLIRIPAKFRSVLDCDDIVQEIARTLQRMSLSKRYSEEEWGKLLHTVTRRQIRKQLIKFRAKTHEQSTCAEHVQAKSHLSNCDSIQLSALLTKCTPLQKEIISMRLQGLTFEDIGTRLGLSKGTVLKRLQSVSNLIECDDATLR